MEHRTRIWSLTPAARLFPELHKEVGTHAVFTTEQVGVVESERSDLLENDLFFW